MSTFAGPTEIHIGCQEERHISREGREGGEHKVNIRWGRQERETFRLTQRERRSYFEAVSDTHALWFCSLWYRLSARWTGFHNWFQIGDVDLHPRCHPSRPCKGLWVKPHN